MTASVKVVKTIEVECPGLGDRIKEGRELAKRERGLTITQVAAAAGMSVQNWYRIEKERQTLPLETLRLIEQVLGIDLGVNFD